MHALIVDWRVYDEASVLQDAVLRELLVFPELFPSTIFGVRILWAALVLSLVRGVDTRRLCSRRVFASTLRWCAVVLGAACVYVFVCKVMTAIVFHTSPYPLHYHLSITQAHLWSAVVSGSCGMALLARVMGSSHGVVPDMCYTAIGQLKVTAHLGIENSQLNTYGALICYPAGQCI